MSTFEIIVSFLASGIFLAFLGMFYKMGSHHKEMELNFKHIDRRFEGIDKRFENIEIDIRDIKKDLSKLDKEIGIITATLRFNGFDLDRHKAEGE